MRINQKSQPAPMMQTSIPEPTPTRQNLPQPVPEPSNPPPFPARQLVTDPPPPPRTSPPPPPPSSTSLPPPPPPPSSSPRPILPPPIAAVPDKEVIQESDVVNLRSNFEPVPAVPGLLPISDIPV
jgi:hypothetical protein